MRLFPTETRTGLWALCLLLPGWIALTTPAGAETLEVKGVIYENVVIRSTTPSHLTISHDGGISQIALADLPDEWQAQLGYDPAVAGRHQAKIDAQTRHRINQAEGPEPSKAQAPQGFTALRPSVDMRSGQPETITRAKDQGNRPVNDIYALVTAVEFAYANRGEPVSLSEEFVLWAVQDTFPTLTFGQGVHFPEIIQAIQIHGICREDLYPNLTTRPVGEVSEPPLSAVNDATSRRNLQTTAIQMKGKASLAQILFNLNQNRPVVIALGWPHKNAFRQNATLREQEPIKDSMHVVTLIGYRPDPENPDAVLLIFRNSFGPAWGAAGYGYVALDYLNRHLIGGFSVDLY